MEESASMSEGTASEAQTPKDLPPAVEPSGVEMPPAPTTLCRKCEARRLDPDASWESLKNIHHALDCPRARERRRPRPDAAGARAGPELKHYRVSFYGLTWEGVDHNGRIAVTEELGIRTGWEGVEAQQCFLTAMASLELWDESRKATAELIHARAQELRLELYEGACYLLQDLDGENPALQDHVQDVITFGAEKSFKLFQILPVGVLRKRNLVVWREGPGGQLEPLLLSGGSHRAPSTGALLVWKGHCTSIRPKSRRFLSELAEVLQEYPSRVLPIARPRSKLMNMGLSLIHI